MRTSDTSRSRSSSEDESSTDEYSVSEYLDSESLDGSPVTLGEAYEALDRIVDIPALLATTHAEYSDYIKQHCRFSFFHRHGEAGIRRAAEFSDFIGQQAADNSKRNFIAEYSVSGKAEGFVTEGKGNLNAHSYRSLLLKNILFPNLISKEDELLFKALLQTLKKGSEKTCIAKLICDVLEGKLSLETIRSEIQYINDPKTIRLLEIPIDFPKLDTSYFPLTRNCLYENSPETEKLKLKFQESIAAIDFPSRTIIEEIQSKNKEGKEEFKGACIVTVTTISPPFHAASDSYQQFLAQQSRVGPTRSLIGMGNYSFLPRNNELDDAKKSLLTLSPTYKVSALGDKRPEESERQHMNSPVTM